MPGVDNPGHLTAQMGFSVKGGIHKLTYEEEGDVQVIQVWAYRPL